MKESHHSNRLVQAYDRMMERAKIRLEEFQHIDLHAGIEHAAEKAIVLGELTREEARLIGGYLRRDLQDAGQYLRATGRDLSAWLRFDIELLEDRLLDFFRIGLDPSRPDMSLLEEPDIDGGDGIECSNSNRPKLPEYLSGEITGPGTLQCEQCGELVVFYSATAIDPCFACGGKIFLRVEAEC